MDKVEGVEYISWTCSNEELANLGVLPHNAYTARTTNQVLLALLTTVDCRWNGTCFRAVLGKEVLCSMQSIRFKLSAVLIRLIVHYSQAWVRKEAPWAATQANRLQLVKPKKDGDSSRYARFLALRGNAKVSINKEKVIPLVS